ncbi:MAG TPA: hypothetical protein EYP59_16200 [Thiotrichaceae bacterium]|nr:hypothetical protein [Thiotrichaceae bacterium]
MPENPQLNIAHPIDAYMENMDELTSLMTIYSHVSSHPLKTSSGEPCTTEILLKQGIVFIVTCWDEYIKQLVTSAFDFMLAHAENPDVFPLQVKMLSSQKLQPPHPDSFDNDVVRRRKQKVRENWDAHLWKQDIWHLAGEGWIRLLRENKEEVMKQYVDTFQSPRPDNVDKLFSSIIGIKRLSSDWTWLGMSCEDAKKCLNIVLNLRGDLVHTNQSHRLVTIDDIDYFSLLVNKLAGISANVVREHVYKQTGQYPWLDSGILDVPAYQQARCK